MEDSASIFEISADDHQRTSRWKVELLLEREPERASLRRRLNRLLKGQGLGPEKLAVTFVQA